MQAPFLTRHYRRIPSTILNQLHVSRCVRPNTVLGNQIFTVMIVISIDNCIYLQILICFQNINYCFAYETREIELYILLKTKKQPYSKKKAVYRRRESL
jgi:type IV secretory pathway VirB3-like protein